MLPLAPACELWLMGYGTEPSDRHHPIPIVLHESEWP
jgi:hypothetical protein